ncbi:MAG: FtsX-like permease family protein [Treponemataceae bacterium]|nr:FtsX-like permease family protein [Treponemataceae bacterium]
MLFQLAFKNIMSRKSSIVIIIFIAISLTLMTVINAVFESTEHGVETVYTKSFTGDLVIRYDNNQPLSLFGDETPMTGYLTTIPTLVPFSEVQSVISAYSAVESVVPQVTIQTAIECGDERDVLYAFGVPGQSYLAAMPSISIIEGTPFGDNERGAMLSTGTARSLHAQVGDEIQFIVQDGISARIRAVPVTAIYEYAVANSVLEKMVLVDSFTVRSLAGMTGTSISNEQISEEKTDLLDGDFDLDDLFGEAEDMDAFFIDNADESLPAADVTESVPEYSPADFSESTTWNYLLVRLHDSDDASSVIRSLNRQFRKNSWPVEATNWRNAAGSTALYLYWIRLIFNIGVIVILAAGFIIINNTLVVGVLNRTQEIGTLRAEGASRLFISLQCMIETFTLTVSAGVLACILGFIVSAAVSRAGITFDNSFLIQLFGADTLNFAPTWSTIGSTLGMSIILGLVGWIYPVRTALRVSPVQAMQGAS